VLELYFFLVKRRVSANVVGVKKIGRVERELAGNRVLARCLKEGEKEGRMTFRMKPPHVVWVIPTDNTLLIISRTLQQEGRCRYEGGGGGTGAGRGKKPIKNQGGSTPRKGPNNPLGQALFTQTAAD